MQFKILPSGFPASLPPLPPLGAQEEKEDAPRDPSSLSASASNSRSQDGLIKPFVEHGEANHESQGLAAGPRSRRNSDPEPNTQAGEIRDSETGALPRTENAFIEAEVPNRAHALIQSWKERLAGFVPDVGNWNFNPARVRSYVSGNARRVSRSRHAPFFLGLCLSLLIATILQYLELEAIRRLPSSISWPKFPAVFEQSSGANTHPPKAPSHTPSAFDQVFDKSPFSKYRADASVFTPLAQNMGKLKTATKALATEIRRSDLAHRDPLAGNLNQFAEQADAASLALLQLDVNMGTSFRAISVQHMYARTMAEAARVDEQGVVASFKAALWDKEKRSEEIAAKEYRVLAQVFNEHFQGIFEDIKGMEVILREMNKTLVDIEQIAESDERLVRYQGPGNFFTHLWSDLGRYNGEYEQNLKILENLYRFTNETHGKVDEIVMPLRNDRLHVMKLEWLTSPEQIGRKTMPTEKHWEWFVWQEFEAYADGRERAAGVGGDEKRGLN